MTPPDDLDPHTLRWIADHEDAQAKRLASQVGGARASAAARSRARTLRAWAEKVERARGEAGGRDGCV